MIVVQWRMVGWGASYYCCQHVVGSPRGALVDMSASDSTGADDGSMWLVTILSGLGIGTIGAWLDVLVRWCVRVLQCPVVLTHLLRRRLGDLRDGRCTYGFFYNQVMCCSGLDRAHACSTSVGYTDVPWFSRRSML